MNTKKTKSLTYLLYYFNKYIPLKYKENLINTFIHYNEKGFVWCMLFKFSGDIGYTDYERELTSNTYFIGMENGTIPDTDLFIFEIPEELLDVINLFIDGKYSELPDIDGHSEFLIQLYRIDYNHPLIKILKKDDDYRIELQYKLKAYIPEGAELASIPSLDEETYYPISQ